ncbi:MAG: AAA family ATPase [Acidobacteria bacterium]|nr:AAA family ATPase [Acidobacteriota bacterium]
MERPAILAPAGRRLAPADARGIVDAMRPDSPHIVLICGPNGAGKSTLAPRLLTGALRVKEFVNADVVARGLSAFQPEEVSLAAGRIMLGRLRELARQRASFAFETTLASRSFAPWISRLKASGYAFHLLFLWLPDDDLAVSRVAGRARHGGHRVAEDVIRRRYRAGLSNFFTLYQPLASKWRVYDNSLAAGPRLIASGRGSAVRRVVDRRTWGRFREGATREAR